MSDLAQSLLVFTKVAEHKSFAEASRELNMANSSVTRHIASLEKELGVALFIRTTRLVRLSPAGEGAYVHAMDILHKVDELKRTVHAQDGRVSGLLRLSVPWRYARLYIAPILSGFMKLYPDIRVEIVSDDRMVNLVDAGFDAAIRIGRLADSSLIAKKIAEQSFVLAAAPSYLRQHARIETHDDLEGHTILTFSYAAANDSWKLKKSGHTYRVPAREGKLATNNADLITAAAVEGVGIIIQPIWAVQDQIKNGSLVPILSDYEVTSTAFETGIFVVYSKENKHNPCVRAWIDYVSEQFKLKT
ncbi:HTH-type transcriptional regulator DmlR [Pseudovibrio axinellae]|uniref:HTH-type transcriptional regulator DmlR n=1 Tax=Pseudovibrio axinellae TaxID=989403 RepID=A0A165UPE4_9HYPH|nr:LysR family transcriptional regulator [Pseudovibrio axinellae]KZL12653.1 HTH-type transcriptional regulator DmlR [Pseudovibrio axinellae]SEP62835.1 DNA-binding transcriptional regulator, LysR family [Pseudovibrio axinellae]